MKFPILIASDSRINSHAATTPEDLGRFRRMDGPSCCMARRTDAESQSTPRAVKHLSNRVQVAHVEEASFGTSRCRASMGQRIGHPMHEANRLCLCDWKAPWREGCPRLG